MGDMSPEDRIREAKAEAVIAEKVEGWQWFTAAFTNVLIPPYLQAEFDSRPSVYGKGKEHNRKTNWLEFDEQGNSETFFSDEVLFPRFPHYFSSMQDAGRLLGAMRHPKLSFSFSIWGVPSISSVFLGYQVAFQRDVFPPKRKYDPSVTVVEDEVLSRAISLAVLAAIGEDISSWTSTWSSSSATKEVSDCGQEVL